MGTSSSSSNEFTDGPPSSSSPSPLLLQPWWRSPERILAVIGAIALRFTDKLGEEWTAGVLLAALGAPLTKWLVAKARGRLCASGK